MEKKKLWSTIIDKNVNLTVIKTISNNIKNNIKNNKINKNNIKEEKNVIIYSLDDKEYLDKLDKIIKLDNFSEINSLELLQKQEVITNYLSKYSIQNTKLNFDFINTNIMWLSTVSKNLANRINQKINIHSKTKKNKNSISRSSYKFCTFTSQCEYNYGSKKKSCCSDHYVHAYIYADLISLNQYIKTKTINDGFIESNREITKCINTIAYVVRHMYDELKNVCLYQNKNNYENVHINKKKYKYKHV
jgi:hypothetical protein